MADEIETTEELIDLAVLRQVVIHELAANRGTPPGALGMDLQPEELHAPGSPDDDVAMSLSTRLEDCRLGVQCRIETCNSYGSFVVNGEAIFDLPAPVSSGNPDIIDEFTEQVGVTAVFPYLRAAVALLAAQMSVPASPLPLLRAGAMMLTRDDEPVVEDEPSEFFMRGTMTTTTDDGGQEEVAEFFVDPETGIISRFGGEGQTPELDELLNALAEAPPPDEMTWEWMIRRSGDSAVRQSIEALREANGDAATDLALAEIDEAVAHIEAEDAFLALNTAVENLDVVILAVRSTAIDRESIPDADVSMELLEAAERVRDGWERVTNANSS